MTCVSQATTSEPGLGSMALLAQQLLAMQPVHASQTCSCPLEALRGHSTFEVRDKPPETGYGATVVLTLPVTCPKQ